MKVLLVLAAAFSIAAGFGFAPPRDHLNRNVTYSCTKDGNIGHMNVYISTADDLDLIYLQHPDNISVNSIGVLDSNGGITGTGMPNDPFTFSVSADCSANPLSVMSDNLTAYSVQAPDELTLSLMLKSRYVAPYFASGYFLNDSRHTLTCNFTTADSGRVDLFGIITDSIDENGVLLVGGNPVLTMIRDNIGPLPSTLAGLGQIIHFEVTLPPSSDAFGLYVYDCFISSDPSFASPIQIIDSNGCSVDSDYFAAFASAGNVYTTSSFPAYMIDNQPLFFMYCTVKLCFTPADPKCDDFCAYNTVGRKKRQAEPTSTSEPKIISNVFRIEFQVPEGTDVVIQPQQPQHLDKNAVPTSSNDLQTTGLLAAVITLAALLLVCLIVAVGAFLHLSSRNRKQEGKA